ncbi:hypothetical protein Goshw_002322 [Gossypium schwendimanii]|uniref:RNase H type-1 domain-containing protein n=1 Tax=Gossypium schwendimanii TaxID=34291 RepID=A0A7J9NC23_GOSSC|nr:hypothetical protein [Gossypium schwendimanii]
METIRKNCGFKYGIDVGADGSKGGLSLERLGKKQSMPDVQGEGGISGTYISGLYLHSKDPARIRYIGIPTTAEAWACLHVITFGEELGFREMCGRGLVFILAKKKMDSGNGEIWVDGNLLRKMEVLAFGKAKLGRQETSERPGKKRSMSDVQGEGGISGTYISGLYLHSKDRARIGHIAIPTTAEAWACLHAITFGEELGFREICFEEDSLMVFILAKKKIGSEMGRSG